MTDGTHAMRGCEPCQGRKAAAISIVSCVPWEFSAPSILRLRMDSADESRRFFVKTKTPASSGGSGKLKAISPKGTTLC